MLRVVFGAIIILVFSLAIIGSLDSFANPENYEPETFSFVDITFYILLLFGGWKLYRSGQQKMFRSSKAYKMARDMYDTDKRVNLDQIEANLKSKYRIITKIRKLTGFAKDADTVATRLGTLQKEGLFPVDAELHSDWTSIEDPKKVKFKWAGVALSIWATLEGFEIVTVWPSYQDDVFKGLYLLAGGCFLAAKKVKLRQGEELLKLSCGTDADFTCPIPDDPETQIRFWLTSEAIFIHAKGETAEHPYSSVRSVSLKLPSGRLKKKLAKTPNILSICFDDGQESNLGFGGFGKKAVARRAEVVELIESKIAQAKNTPTPPQAESHPAIQDQPQAESHPANQDQPQAESTIEASIKIHCPKCGQKYRLDTNMAGSKISCQICGSDFKVEETEILL